MRLLVLKAFSRAIGSSAANTLPREGASAADGASGMIRARGSTPWQETQFGISCRHLQGASFPQRLSPRRCGDLHQDRIQEDHQMKILATVMCAAFLYAAVAAQ